MYNGIGLTTPRGSGTNGHVQRNWAFVRPGKKDNSNYRSEEDIKKLDATLNRPPNKDILDHDRKRKIEVKCLEFEEILEKQGLSSDDIKAKVESYRKKLIGQGRTDMPKDEFGRITVRDSHQIAEAQQEKNAKLREAFNISEYFVEGSSFDSDRKAKEDLAKSLALQKELDTQRDQSAATAAKETSKRHILERTPSMEHDISSGGVCGIAADNGDNTIKKKKKKKTRESSTSPDRKKDKKKKSKKRKKESKSKKSKKLRKRKVSELETNAGNYQESADEDSESDIDTDIKRSRKKAKRDKKKRRNKKKEVSSSSDKSRSMSPVNNSVGNKKNETDTKRKSSDDEFVRGRSNERSHKPRESRKHHYESSQYNRSRRSHSRNDKSRVKTYSSNKNVSTRRRSCSRTERNEHRRSRDFRSRELSNTNYKSKDRESRSSASRKSSKHEITDEYSKSLKRKRHEEYSQTKRNSPEIDKRKRYSRSHSPLFTIQNRDKKYVKSTEIKNDSSRSRSRTPRHKPPDNQKKHKSGSRSSSAKEISRQKSLTPPSLTPKKTETKNCDRNTFNNPEKIEKSKLIAFKFSSKKSKGSKSRSRHSSTSSSDTTSSIDTIISKRNTSPKKERLEKISAYKSIDSQNIIEKEIKSPSPIRTPTPARRRSISASISGHVINEKSAKDKEDCGSKEKKEKIDKAPISPRSSRDSSELSYSPARRNPERYRDILENNKIHKSEKLKTGDREEDRKEVTKLLKQSEEREWDRKEKTHKNDRNQANPVVRLQSQSDEDSDTTERNTEKILDEFQDFKRERELKEFKMLEQLKTDIAAKAKEKIKTIEKMAASTLGCSSSTNNDEEVSDKSYNRTVRNSLNEFMAANNVVPAVVATCSTTTYNSKPFSPPGAIYPQTLEEIKKEQESITQLTDTSNQLENKNVNNNMDTESQVICKKPLGTANGNALLLSPTTSPTRSNVNVMNKERDRKRERDIRERERERETNYFNKERYLERRQRSSPNFYSNGGGGNSGAIVSGNIVGGRRNINNGNITNTNHRQQRLNLVYNSGGVGSHHHSHPHLHLNYHHPNHKIINHHTSSPSNIYIANNSSTNPHALVCNHGNNSTNLSFNRPSRINNTPLITATQFNNQMLSKQSNSILVNRRDHRTALNLGLSGTPCTNFSNSNLLLTKANTNPHHLRAAAVGHVGGGSHHHQFHHHHHHHHHGQSASMSSGGSNSTTQITDRILMAASIAAARHSLGVHSAVSSASAVAAVNNLNFLQQQNKPKLVIKPFKINDSQPLVAALADSSLVDAIVSKVSTATVAAAESAARRSRSRSRRSRSRNRHEEKTSSGGSRGGDERDGSRRHSTSRSRSSRSSTSSRSRSRSHSHRRTRSHSSQSSSSSHTSSHSTSSSSFGSSRSGTRSPSIPRRRGSPSFLDRRRITSRHSSCRHRRH